MNDVNGMVQHINALSGTPTFEQLETKVKSLSKALEKDVLTLPPRIKQLVQHGFDMVGWNMTTRAVTDKSKFVVDNLSPAFENIQQGLLNWSPPVEPTADELADLAKAANKLWELDLNRLLPGRDYVINVQDGKLIYEQGDVAVEALFTFVDEKALQKPTYAAFISLLDNYIAATGSSEVVTNEEVRENNDFLNLCMDTAVMQYVHQYLLAKGKTRATDRDAFIREVYKVWFGLYSRKAHNDSSGFEHVFVGEVKTDTNEITGFHNWIQLYIEEKKKTFDYRGYIRPKKRGHNEKVPHSCEQFISIQFEWKGAIKNVSSSFIGTSPEFEVALYTLCFFMGETDNVVNLGPYRVNITCHRWPANPKPGQFVYIASTFPSEAPAETSSAPSGGAKGGSTSGGNNKNYTKR